MAIKRVRAQLNGTWYNLTLNSETGKYEATITAPNITSFNQPNHVYEATVVATNTAGTSTTVNGDDFEGLNLRVLEKIPPVITLLSPSDGAYVNTNKPEIKFTVVDETNGSGVDISQVILNIDSNQYSSSNLTHESIANGYSFSFIPTQALGEGSHSISITAKDFDGNAATAVSATFTVDTVPPSLNITSPQEGYITAVSALTVTGTTNDVTSSPVTVTIKLNSVDQGAVSVGTGGAFSKTITLAEGANVIEVTATDSAGRSTTVTRNVTLDTSAPEIISATITPNPADAGASVIISVEVSG